MRKLSVLVLLLLTVVGAFEGLNFLSEASLAKKASQSERRKPSASDVPFSTIDTGAVSGVTSRDSFVIKDDGEWVGLWKRHTSNQFPGPPIPRVDFSSEMVVAVFAGERGSGGYQIQVDRINDLGNRLVVAVSESYPGSGPGSDSHTMGMTHPFHIVRLARSSLPVVFQGM